VSVRWISTDNVEKKIPVNFDYAINLFDYTLAAISLYCKGLTHEHPKRVKKTIQDPFKGLPALVGVYFGKQCKQFVTN